MCLSSSSVITCVSYCYELTSILLGDENKSNLVLAVSNSKCETNHPLSFLACSLNISIILRSVLDSVERTGLVSPMALSKLHVFCLSFLLFFSYTTCVFFTCSTAFETSACTRAYRVVALNHPLNRLCLYHFLSLLSRSLHSSFTIVASCVTFSIVLYRMTSACLIVIDRQTHSCSSPIITDATGIYILINEIYQGCLFTVLYFPLGEKIKTCVLVYILV